jgi:hypothetical protein
VVEVGGREVGKEKGKHVEQICSNHFNFSAASSISPTIAHQVSQRTFYVLKNI